MNIGIDLDGVLTDIQGFNRRHAPRFFKRKFKRAVVDERPYDIRDIFACPEQEYQAYWSRYLLWYATIEPARGGARELTLKLCADDHSVYIISKRVFAHQHTFMGLLMRALARNWLWRNRIRYKAIVFCDNDVPASKKDACLENHIDIMIDDETVNIRAIAPIAKVICFDASYNHDCGGMNIMRAKNFDEAYSLIYDHGLSA